MRVCFFRLLTNENADVIISSDFLLTRRRFGRCLVLPVSHLGTADPGLMRKLNKDAVLELVRQAGPISRADLARHTLLSPSTISAITVELIEAQLVRETGAGLSRGGRRPVLLEFNREAGVVVGVEMGVTHLTVLVTNLAPDIQVRYEVPFNVAAGDWGHSGRVKLTRTTDHSASIRTLSGIGRTGGR